MTHHVKLSLCEKKQTLNFIQPVIKQESSLPNQHLWGNDWDNKHFHNLALLITKSGLLIQKHHSLGKKKKKHYALAEMFPKEIWLEQQSGNELSSR